MVTAKVNKNQHRGVTDTIQCIITNLTLPKTPTEIVRQEMFRRLLESCYSKTDLLLNSSFLGQNGETISADIIILNRKIVLHTEPLLIICISKPSESFNYDWVQSFQGSGANAVAWFNGEKLKLFSQTSEKKYRELPPFLPSLVTLNQPEKLGIYRSKLSLSPGYDLKRILTDLHDHLYGNSNIRIPSRLGIEIQKLLLVKRFDEEQSSETCEFCIYQNELSGGLNGHKTISPEAFFSVGSRIRALAVQHDALRKKEQKIGSLELDDSSLYYSVFQLEGISLNATPTDVLGDALETFRTLTIKREGGQFFTHRYVVDLALKLVGFSGEENQTLADISCGTSGFLHHARNLVIHSAKKKGILKEEEHNQLICKLLLGVEIDQELVQISNTSPEFSKLPKKIVERHDSLAPFENWTKLLSSRLAINSRAFVVGNPPFGTKITVKDLEILNKFALAHAWSRKNQKWEKTQRIVPRPPDVLFIERNLNLLIPEIGRMVLVVPYQILSGPKEGFVREWLMTNCKILAIVDLPEDTFQPYTGTKGALLVIEKRLASNSSWEDEPEYSIFMACPQKVGHDRRGRPMFKDKISGEVDTDLPEIAEAFDTYLDKGDPSKVTRSAFIISSKLIKRVTDIRLNAAYYRPSSSDLRKQISLIVKNDSSLTITLLGDLVNDIFYPGRFKRDYTEIVEGSVPFFGGSNITELIPVTKKRILKSSSYYQTLALKKGWILITRSGTTGIVATVPEDWEGYAASEHIIRIIPNPERLHPGYLYGYLRSTIGQNLLRDGVFGSVVDEINCNYIASIPILHPKDLNEAKEVGKKIYEADALRAKASKLILETSQEIEDYANSNLKCISV
jgi:hypothetical protein